jgi:hypothetical protein
MAGKRVQDDENRQGRKGPPGRSSAKSLNERNHGAFAPSRLQTSLRRINQSIQENRSMHGRFVLLNQGGLTSITIADK